MCFKRLDTFLSFLQNLPEFGDEKRPHLNKVKYHLSLEEYIEKQQENIQVLVNYTITSQAFGDIFH